MTDNSQSFEAERESDTKTNTPEEQALQSRRGFLLGLGKWSRAVIVGVVAGGALLTDKPAQAGVGWINRRGGGGRGWLNGSGGGSWANRRGGGWGGSWANRR